MLPFILPQTYCKLCIQISKLAWFSIRRKKKISQKDDDYDNEVVITIYFTYIMQALGKLLSGRALIIHLA